MTVLRLAAVLAAVVVGGPLATAQEVRLGDWTLPEGAVVRSTSTTVMAGAIHGAGSEIPMKNEVSEVAVTVIDSVASGRLEQALQTLLSSETLTQIGGAPTPARADPLLGREVRIVRDGDGWRSQPAGWQPTASQREALAEPTTLDDAEYPDWPVAVGETVEVDDAALRHVYLGAAEGPHRLTVRLDSVGTVDGGPAAFLTQAVGVTTVIDGGTMRMDMTAHIVRRLDWLIDVSTVWEGPVSFLFGDGVIKGTMTHRATQTVELPTSP